MFLPLRIDGKFPKRFKKDPILTLKRFLFLCSTQIRSRSCFRRNIKLKKKNEKKEWWSGSNDAVVICHAEYKLNWIRKLSRKKKSFYRLENWTKLFYVSLSLFKPFGFGEPEKTPLTMNYYMHDISIYLLYFILYTFLFAFTLSSFSFGG